MTRPSLVRSSAYLYSIEGYSNHGYWAGSTANGLQVLVVMQIPHLVGLFFDQEGNLVDVQVRTLSLLEIPVSDAVERHRDTVKAGEVELMNWLDSLGFEEGIIKVKRFFLEDYYIGILDFPECFKQVLLNPSGYSEDEQIGAQRAVRRWFKEGIFELWLNEGTDLWITSAGEVESS